MTGNRNHYLLLLTLSPSHYWGQFRLSAESYVRKRQALGRRGRGVCQWDRHADMQRRAQIGLNKGEAHHALKNALRIGRQGEIRDRTSEGQHFRIADLNLLAVIVIYWNTLHLHDVVEARRRDGLDVPPELLAHISPLCWAHILLTGEYRWPKDAEAV